MFFKLGALLALATPLVSALTIVAPTNIASSSVITVNWTAEAGDPQVFTMELVNTVFHNSFAVASNVQTGLMSLTFELGVIPPGDGYSLEFVNIGNISDVFTSTGDFSVAPAPSSTTSSGSSTTTAPGTASTVAPNTSGLGSTVSSSSGASTGGTSTTGTSTSSGATGSTSTFNNGAVALGISHSNLVSYGLMAVAALMGAGFVAF